MVYDRIFMKRLCLPILVTLIFSLAGCGFHLRGDLNIPISLRLLAISPDQPLDAFQKTFRRILVMNHVQIQENRNCPANTLCLLNQSFSERGLAYGTDLQINRILLQFKVEYQILDPEGNIIVACNTLQVGRELTINPNAVLGTEHDRLRVQNELYEDAAMQLIRRLSLLKLN